MEEWRSSLRHYTHTLSGMTYTGIAGMSHCFVTLPWSLRYGCRQQLSINRWREMASRRTGAEHVGESALFEGSTLLWLRLLRHTLAVSLSPSRIPVALLNITPEHRHAIIARIVSLPYRHGVITSAIRRHVGHRYHEYYVIAALVGGGTGITIGHKKSRHVIRFGE